MWMPMHSTVAGGLPLAELPETGGYSVAYFEVDVETSGTMALAVHPPNGMPEGISVWVDGQAATLSEGQIEFVGETGRRRITLAIDRAQHAEGALQVKLLAGPGSAEAAIVKEW